jgi:replicative DNA helicase
LLDDLLGGFQKANLMVIAGSSGIGKSGLAMQLGINAALGTSVLLCSLQVSGPELVARHAETLEISAFQDAIKAEVSRRGAETVEGGQSRSTTEGVNESITDLELGAIRMGGEQANGLKLAILDVPRLRVGSLRAYCTRMAESVDLGLIIVDQIELLRADRTLQDPIDELDEVARDLKQLARDLDCPVVTTARYEGAPVARPSLSELRERNTISYHADIVVTLTLGGPENLELTVVKNRNGGLGHFAVRWMRDGLQPPPNHNKW